MVKQILSVYDNVAQVFSHPFFAINVGSGTRDFYQACKDPASNIGRSPDDFNLYHLGSFDDVQATFEIFDAPVRVALGINSKE